MPLEFRRSEVCLSGSCTAEEALDLAEWLAKRKRPKTNLAECTHMHTALLQTLLAYKPQISAPPADAFLATWVMPALDAATASSAQAVTE
jgi:hypothetical protein